MPKKSKPSCNHCKKTIRTNQKSINCSKCLKSFHVNCSIKTSNSNYNKKWTCEICSNWASPFNSLTDTEVSELYANPKQSKFCYRPDQLNTIFANTPLKDCDTNDDFSQPNITETYLDSSTIHSLTDDTNFENMFSSLCVNTRSIVNPKNVCKLEALLMSLPFKPDIIAVTETWIQPNSKGPYLNLPGYNFISNSRQKCRGGGTLYI